MSEQCPKCGAKRLSRPYVSAYDPADEWSCGTSRGHFSGVAEGNACLKNQLAARDAELAEARAEIERLRTVNDLPRTRDVDAWAELSSRCRKIRAEVEGDHTPAVGCYSQVLAWIEELNPFAPAPPEREDRPARPVMLIDRPHPKRGEVEDEVITPDASVRDLEGLHEL